MNLQELKIFETLYACGAITKNSIFKCGGDEDTIISLMDKKLIKKNRVEIKDNAIAVYTLSKQGEKFYTEQTQKKYFYRCNNYKKAVRISYIYMDLSEEEKNTWKNKDEWLAEYNDSAIPDATFIKNNSVTAITVMKKDEKDEKIKDLKKFADIQKINKFKIMYYDTDEK